MNNDTSWSNKEVGKRKETDRTQGLQLEKKLLKF